MNSGVTIYQASDLNQRGRAVLDAARAGEARVRDKDGMSLVMLPEGRLRALQTVARTAANLAALEHAIIRSQSPTLQEYGDWTWLRVFDHEDLQEFVSEMREALIVAGREESPHLIEEALYRWRATAQSLEDPLRRSILLGTVHDSDFVEVGRPEYHRRLRIDPTCGWPS